MDLPRWPGFTFEHLSDHNSDPKTKCQCSADEEADTCRVLKKNHFKSLGTG